MNRKDALIVLTAAMLSGRVPTSDTQVAQAVVFAAVALKEIEKAAQ